MTSLPWLDSEDLRRALAGERFVAPRSPFKLLQEDFSDVPRKLCVVSMMVGRAPAERVREIVPPLFQEIEYQSSFTNLTLVEKILRPLGLSRVKTVRIGKFLDEWRNAIASIAVETRRNGESAWAIYDDSFPLPREAVSTMSGVGPYTLRCYDVFVRGVPSDDPPDHHLDRYVTWAKDEGREVYRRGRVNVGPSGAPDYGPEIDPEIPSPSLDTFGHGNRHATLKKCGACGAFTSHAICSACGAVVDGSDLAGAIELLSGKHRIVRVCREEGFLAIFSEPKTEPIGTRDCAACGLPSTDATRSTCPGCGAKFGP